LDTESLLSLGKPSYHLGIDIGSPKDSIIISIFSGIVTYTGFNGAYGYTVIIENDEFSAAYSHISPYFLVYVGQPVTQGMVIATVGPKNVYGVFENPYRDSKGNPTNGATTGPHLHLTIKKDDKVVNPLNYLTYISSSSL